MKSHLDLNLLKVLILLNQHKRLKDVAKILGKSEASVSKYLGRLREQFGNELFSQDPQNGYEPTPFMLSVLPQIENSLNTLDHLLEKKRFNPESISREITIAMPQFAQYFVSDQLLMRLIHLFPHATFRFTSWDDDSPQKILDEQIDIGIQLFNEELPKTIYQKNIGRLSYSIVIPEQLSHLNFKEICELPFALPTVKGWQFKHAAQALLMAKEGVELNIIAYIDSISGVLNSIQEMGGATILATPPKQLPGFHFKELLLPHENIPSVAALVKLNNRNNSFYQLLMNELRLSSIFNTTSLTER